MHLFKKIPFLFVLLFIIFAMPSVCRAQAVKFQLDSKSKEYHVKKIGEKPEESETKEQTFVVILEPSKISVRTGDTEKIYDFSDDTLTLINHEKKELQKTSLYAIPAFNDYEKKNRLVLSNVFEGAKIDVLKTDMFYLETLFGDNPASEIAKKVEIKEEGNTTRYIYKNEDVTTVSFPEYPIDEALKDAYKKYLVYEHSVHPMVWDEMSKKGAVFSSLSYQIKQEVPVLIEKSFSASGISDKDIEPISVPETYTKNYASDEKLDRIIKRSMTEERKTPESFFVEMDALYKQKKYIDAALAFFEYTVQVGEVDDVQAHKEILQRVFKGAPKESGVMQLGAAISQQPKSKEQLQKAIQTIEAFRKKDLTHGYILNVYLANYLDMAGKTEQAKVLMLEALEHNPFLTGAYKDLGDKYFRSYDMWNAWACWDYMRKINPDHMLVSHIAGMEKKIREIHPVYFSDSLRTPRFQIHSRIE